MGTWMHKSPAVTTHRKRHLCTMQYLCGRTFIYDNNRPNAGGWGEASRACCEGDAAMNRTDKRINDEEQRERKTERDWRLYNHTPTLAYLKDQVHKRLSSTQTWWTSVWSHHASILQCYTKLNIDVTNYIICTAIWDDGWMEKTKILYKSNQHK